jgi:deoxyribodipyrimidine photolyase
MANLEIIRKNEGIHCQWQMYNFTKHLNSLQTSTTEAYPDYPEFHKVFQNDMHPTTSTPITDIPHFHALLNHTTEPPPFIHVPSNPPPDSILYDQLIRQRRQALAGLGAVAGV